MIYGVHMEIRLLLLSFGGEMQQTWRSWALMFSVIYKLELPGENVEVNWEQNGRK